MADRPNWDCECRCHSTGLVRDDPLIPKCCDKPNTIWPAKPTERQEGKPSV